MNRPSYEALEAAWQALPPAPTKTGSVLLLVVRRSVSQMAKRDRPPGYHVLRKPYHQVPPRVTLDPTEGIIGDRWSKKKNKAGDQISLTSAAVMRLVTGGDSDRFHLSGDNMIVDFDLSATALPSGTRLAVGDATIEISEEPHTPCNRYEARFGKDARRWIDAPVHASRHLRGRYARVIEGGIVEIGARISRLEDRT